MGGEGKKGKKIGKTENEREMGNAEWRKIMYEGGKGREK